MDLSELFRLDERIANIVDALRPYAEREDIYISYRSIPKLGINPQSTYDTPIGIYAYPLKEMWKLVVKDKVPFASGQPYVVVFQANVPDLNAQAPNGYTAAMLERDIAAIKNKFLSRFMESRGNDAASKLEQNMILRHEIEDILIMAALDGYQRGVPAFADWAKLFVTYPEDKVQQFFQHQIKDGVISAETFAAMEKAKHHFNKTSDMQLFSAYVSRWKNEAFSEAPGCSFWNITRELAKQIRPAGSNAPVVWTAIMRALGYEGFSDRTGSGIIHGNEPCQAVFFSIKPVKLIEILHNNKRVMKPKDHFVGHVFYVDDLRELITAYHDAKTSMARKNEYRACMQSVMDHIGEFLSTGRCKWAESNNIATFKASITPESLDRLVAHTGIFTYGLSTRARSLCEFLLNNQQLMSEKMVHTLLGVIFDAQFERYLDEPRWRQLAEDKRTMKLAFDTKWENGSDYLSHAVFHLEQTGKTNTETYKIFKRFLAQ